MRRFRLIGQIRPSKPQRGDSPFDSIPHVPFIPFQFVPPQDFEELVLKCNPAMMLFLIRQVRLHLVELRITHSKCTISALPFEIG